MQRSLVITLIVFLGFSLIIVLNNAFAPFSFLSSVTQTLFSIPKEKLYKAKTTLISGEKIDVLKLIEENKKLIEKVVEFDRLKQDNNAFKSQFETTDIKSANLVPAHVVGFLGDFANPTTLIIDKGGQDGLKKNMVVIVGKNLVGKIGSVSEKFSQVILVLNTQFKTLAKSSDFSASGIAMGEGNFILLDKVAITDDLKEDATITTKGDISENGVGVSQDLIIGKVVSLNKNNSLPFQTAKVESSLSFSHLETVFVMMDK